MLSEVTTGADALDRSKLALGVFFLIAAAGGFFKAMSARLHWKDALVSSGVSGMAGFVVGALCVQLWGPDKWYLTCAIVGVVSWLGGTFVLDALAGAAWEVARARMPQLPQPPAATKPAPTPPPPAKGEVLIDTTR